MPLLGNNIKRLIRSDFSACYYARLCDNVHSRHHMYNTLNCWHGKRVERVPLKDNEMKVNMKNRKQQRSVLIRRSKRGRPHFPVDHWMN